MSDEYKQPEPASNPNNGGDSKGVDPKPVKEKTPSERRLAGLRRTNPDGKGGRPKGLAQLARAQTKDGVELVNFMVRVLKGKERKNTRLADRIKAAEWLADRGYGKAVDFHADVGEGNTLRELAKEVVRLELQGDAKTPANQTK